MTTLKILSLIAVALVWGIQPARAATMSPTVIVDGLEWLQPRDLLGTSWAEMGTVCDSYTGQCNGSFTSQFGTFDLTGWTWASVDDLNALFSSYLSSPLGPGPDSALNEPGILFLFSDFLDTYTDFVPGAHNYKFIRGVTRTATGSSGYIGYVGFSASLSSSTSWGVGTNSTPSLQYEGAWLYRNDVPVPATMGLCMAGLALLIFRRRKFKLTSLTSA